MDNNKIKKDIFSEKELYYRNIIVNYIKNYMYLKDNTLINSLLDNICDEIINENNLHNNILELERLLFNTNYFLPVLCKNSWIQSRKIILTEYNMIYKNDYMSIFKFFLLITHNFPIIKPHSDNSIPGCNMCYDLENSKNSVYCNNNLVSKNYYQDKLNTLQRYNHMRISNWLNMSTQKRFNCYCENYF